MKNRWQYQRNINEWQGVLSALKWKCQPIKESKKELHWFTCILFAYLVDMCNIWRWLLATTTNCVFDMWAFEHFVNNVFSLCAIQVASMNERLQQNAHATIPVLFFWM